MVNAFFWGFVAASSLILGGLITFGMKISSRALGLIMAFGSGVLISAVAYELTHEAIRLSAGSGRAAAGLILGSLAFFIGDVLIDRMGGGERKAIDASHDASLGLPITLGIVLDGIPESIVIGIGLIGSGKVGLTMLIAVFLSNLPEALAATSGLASGGWKRTRIIGLWVFVSLISGLASLAGFALLENAPPPAMSFFQSFAAGAILVMLADTMIPHAFEHGGKLAGLFTVMGFGLAVYVANLS